MYMKLKSVERTPNNKKAFVATFIKDDGKEKIQRLGTGSNFVLNKNKTLEDRKNYIARHRVNEDFNNPVTAGSLSRHLLWGDSRSLQKNINSLKKQFKI